jgi:hypothetical protein
MATESRKETGQFHRHVLCLYMDSVAMTLVINVLKKYRGPAGS